ADSGFGHALTGGSGWTVRGNPAANGIMDLFGEDQPAGAGATPSASVGAGANTTWVMTTLLFKSGTVAPPSGPDAPTGVSAAPGNGSATVSWTAPGNGGAAITSYTVTPYIGTTAQTPVTVTGAPPTTSVTVSGLANGTGYTFTVRATNSAGTGPDSTPSSVVTPSPTPPA